MTEMCPCPHCGAPAAAAALRIQSVPTMVLFRDGRELARTSGAMAAPQIRAFAEAATTKGT